MQQYHFKLEVTGRGAFPVDMLRHSRLYPADPTTVNTMESSLDKVIRLRDPQVYTLFMDHSSHVALDRCVRRFGSFGFDVKVLDELAA